VAAVAGSLVVGAAVAAPGATGRRTEELLAVGVAPAWRRAGLAGTLLRALADGRPAGGAMEARFGVAERDVVDPLPVDVRTDVARRLLEGAGFVPHPASPDIARDDRWAIAGRLDPA
jgi:GNAT superfamily N-acetyltransferase